MAKRIYAQGGLGNQLFIWRAAHHLHAISNEPVQVVYPNEVSSYRHLELKLLLRHCSHSISIKEPKELNKKVKFAQKYPSLNHRIAKMLPPNFRVRVSSSPILGIETLGSKGSDFLGFFQNAKSEKLEIFSPYQEINDVIEEQWQKLRYIQKLSKKEDFQVLHVRRGDYELLKNEYGLLSHRYFSKNLDPSLETIICTDSENLSTNFLSQFKNCLVLTPKDLDSWQTLTLMVGSKYFIGANSTLSWWAARLRVENGSESVLPDPWFKIGDLENNFLTPGITFSRSEFEE